MRHYILILLSLLLSVSVLRAGEITSVSYVTMPTLLSSGGTGSLSVSDYTYIGPNNASNPSYVVKRKALVNLIYGRELQSDISGNNWAVQIKYSISFPGSTQASQTAFLRISSSDPEGVHQSYVEYESSSSDVQLDITSVTFEDYASTLSQAPDDIRVELRLSSEGYFNLSETAVPDLQLSYDATTYQTAASWPYMVGAEEYDLQWVYLDDELYDLQTSLSTSQIANLFAEHSVGVRITDNYYQVPMYYPKGRVLFRVRGVGRHIVGVGSDYSYIKTGAWSNNYSENYGLITLQNGFSQDKNWQYMGIFSDNGGRREVMAYADNSLRNRQSQSYLSTDEITVVGETVYDYEGREALTISPAPAAPGDKTLTYKPNFNMAGLTGGNGQLYTYSARHFDRSWSTVNREPEPLASSNPNQPGVYLGAGSYYSSDNPFTDKLYNSYVPSAEGYPLSHTSVLRDGTGKVRDISGYGKTFQVYNGTQLRGHATRYVYGTPSDTELRRLFGENVGESKYYKKQVLIDANGQAGVTYIDANDRMIATALIGKSPENVLPLDSEVSATYTHSLNAGNIKDYNARTSTNISHIVQSDPSNPIYTFKYSVTGVDDILDGTILDNLGLCASCVYELTITAQDQDENYIDLTLTNTSYNGSANNNFAATMPVGNSSVNYIKGIVQASSTCQGLSYQGPELSFSANFTEVGSYKITKTLRVISDGIALQSTAAWQNVVSHLSAQNLATAQSAVDLTVCDITCAQHCASEYDPTSSTAAYNQCLEDCSNLLDIHSNSNPLPSVDGIVDAMETSGCSSLLDQMRQQIRPSAGLAPGFLTTLPTSGDPLIITVTDVDGISYDIDLRQQSTWSNLSIVLANNPSFVVLGSVSDLYNASVTWQSSWEDAIAQMHPEYCHYESCMSAPMQAKRLGEYQFSLIDDWTEAVAASIVPANGSALNVSTACSNLLSHDPFFNTSNYANIQPFNGSGYTLTSGTLGALSTYVTNKLTNYFSSTTGCPNTDLFSYVRPGNVCSAYSSSNPWSDAGQWHTFIGMYNAIKAEAWESVVVNDANYPCDYLSTPEALVTEPTDASTFTSQQAYTDASSQLVGDNCIYNCEANVDHWMYVLTTNANCPSPISAVHLASIRSHLGSYCMRTCMNLSNPLGIITQDAMNATPQDADLAAVNAILNLYPSCTVAGIPLATPANSLAQAITSTSGYTTTTVVSTSQQPVSYNCSSCEILSRFVDANNPPTTEADLSAITNHIAMLLGHSVSNQALKGAICECTELSSLGWVCNGDIVANGTALLTELQTALPCQTTITIATGVTNTIPVPVFDPAAAEADCEDFLLQEAAYNAAQTTADQVNDLLEAFEFALDACINTPFAENLSYTATSTEHHYTLYYYDQAGSLVRTVPPIGVHPVASSHFTANGVWDGTNPVHTQTTTYKYDGTGQVIESETPDAGITKSWFDDLKRPRFTQDARQAALSQGANPTYNYKYTRNDNLGRAVEVGEIVFSSLAVSNIDNYLNAMANDNKFPEVGTNNQVINLPTGVTATVQYRTETVYGDSPEALLNPPTSAFNQENLRGRVMLSRNETQITRYDYDLYGNVRQLRHEYIFLGNMVKDIRYEYDYISGKTTKVDYQPTVASERFMHRCRYDADNRITHIYTSRDGIVWDQDARYFYYLQGAIARVETGEDHVQGQDYNYTLQGWIKGVNSISGLDGNTWINNNLNAYFAQDAYDYSLGYYEGDYTPIGGGGNSYALTFTQSSSNILAKPNSPRGLFNGNITAMTTQIGKLSDPSGAAVTHSYAYQYDALNRLKGAYSNSLDANGDWTPSRYDCRYMYDANGNIQRLTRNIPTSELGEIPTSTADDLSYVYNPSKPNQLKQVTNAMPTPDLCAPNNFVTQATNNYNYDEIGNLIADNSEGISKVTWDIYGKVRRVQFGTQNTLPTCLQGRQDVTYRYDPTGNRALKFNMYYQTGSLTPSYEGDLYVRDPQGNVLAVYGFNQSQTTTLTTVKEWDIYGSRRIGLRRNVENTVSNANRLSTGALAISSQRYDWASDRQITDTEKGGDALRLQLLREHVVIAAILPDSPLSPDSLDLPIGEAIVLYNRLDAALDLGGLKVEVVQNGTTQTLTLPNGTSIGAQQVLRLVHGTPANENDVRVALGLSATDAILWQTALTLNDDQDLGVGISHSNGGIGKVAIAAADYANVSFNPSAYIAGRARPAVVQAINQKAIEKAAQTIHLSDYFDMSTLLPKTESVTASTDAAEPTEAKKGTSLEEQLATSVQRPSSGGTVGILERGYKVYEYTNHLDNVLLTLTDKVYMNGGVYAVNVVSATDYQPFGAEMALRTFNSTAYRYGFNGKENDRSWGGKWIQDYGFRLYNPSIGRFLSVDPLTASYPWNSVYCFAENDVIRNVDLDGQEKADAVGNNSLPNFNRAVNVSKNQKYGIVFYLKNLDANEINTINTSHSHNIKMEDHGVTYYPHGEPQVGENFVLYEVSYQCAHKYVRYNAFINPVPLTAEPIKRENAPELLQSKPAGIKETQPKLEILDKITPPPPPPPPSKKKKWRPPVITPPTPPIVIPPTLSLQIEFDGDSGKPSDLDTYRKLVQPIVDAMKANPNLKVTLTANVSYDPMSDSKKKGKTMSTKEDITPWVDWGGSSGMLGGASEGTTGGLMLLRGAAIKSTLVKAGISSSRIDVEKGEIRFIGHIGRTVDAKFSEKTK